VSSGRAASSRAVPRWLAPSIVLGVVVLDQLVKVWVVASLSDGPLSIIGNDVELRLTRNSGGAFSLFTNATVVLALLAIVLSIVLVRAVQRARDRLTVVALSMVLGGALGNLTDRLTRSPGFLRGEVVDYVRVGSFPSFNVADSAITIGAILLIIAAFNDAAHARDSTSEHPA
jgi:signal peptidase II